MSTISAERTSHMGRPSVRLSNGLVEAVICPRGGTVPVFAARAREGTVNAHWIPPFRDPKGPPYSEAEHASFWKCRLLYDIAGDFLCSPNFGPDCEVDGVAIPPHGWTASGEWRLEEASADADRGLAFARLAMESPSKGLDLAWERLDLLLVGQGALFSSLRIRNRGDRPLAINIGRHATLGPSFLEKGCRVSACADRYATPPSGSEFSPTGRLAEGAEFKSLSAAPLRSGGDVDLSEVPGMIGFTDLAAGAVPANTGLGWSCVANPRLGLAHLCLFPGPAGLPEGEVALGFNVLWMQYGGRRFQPWALSDGGEDRCFCLGTECGTGAFANGLAESRSVGRLLGSATTVAIPAKGERIFNYCTALVELDGALLQETELGARLGDDGELVLVGRHARQATRIDAGFRALRDFASAK